MDADAHEAAAGPIAARLATALAKVGLALKSRAWRAAAPRGLSPTQGQVLVTLQAAGPLPLQAIAAALGVTPATASDAVHALARKGLVTKARAANDRRALAVSLTPAGRREAERVAEWPDFLAAAASTLSPEEQAVFLRAMVKLIWRLQQRGEISVARMCLGCVFFQPNRYPDPDRPHHCAFTGAPFGDRALRLDCADYQPAAPAAAEAHWVAFSGGH
ncbi:MAG: MarR family transcriptional regulator [Dehalococcoidia bacterium]|nr:MAG: MarR family transcriptional regulator [Dehalococcoidia bacterium]